MAGNLEMAGGTWRSPPPGTGGHLYVPPASRDNVDKEGEARRAKIRAVAAADAVPERDYIGQEYALVPTPIIVMAPPKPNEIGPTTIIPLEVAQPTAVLVGEFGEGEGVPWTAQLVSLSALLQPIGQLLVSIGSELILALAITKMEEGIERVKTRRYNEFASVRFHTGKGFAKPGKAVGPRAPGAEVPSGNTPYPLDEKDEFSWFQPWTWF